MQINRLFEIVYLLLNKKTTTAKELAEHFEVSVRTILRDVDTLSAAGVPVCTSQGKGGGISILDNFVLNKAAISDEEQNQIIFALQNLASTQQFDVSEVLSKLRAFFDKKDTDWIEVDFSRWGNGQEDKRRFDLLKKAIMNRHTIGFVYPSACGGSTRRTVCPLKLVFRSRAWYLQAYCLLKEDYRTFKINRMLEVDVLPDEDFEAGRFTPPPVEAADPPSSPLLHVKLKFAPNTAYRVYDEFCQADIVRDDGGSFIVTVDIPEDYWLYGFLLSFGTSVEVLEPQRVRENLLTQIETIRKFYAKK